ncbi:hypothetical protein Tco_0185613 [Tanacetum coccineum]
MSGIATMFFGSISKSDSLSGDPSASGNPNDGVEGVEAMGMAGSSRHGRRQYRVKYVIANVFGYEALVIKGGGTCRRRDELFTQTLQNFLLEFEKFQGSIKAAVKEEINQEGQSVKLNQWSPNIKVKVRLFWNKYVVACVRTRKPRKLDTSLGTRFEIFGSHKQLQVSIGKLKKILQDYYMHLKHTKGILRSTP